MKLYYPLIIYVSAIASVAVLLWTRPEYQLTTDEMILKSFHTIPHPEIGGEYDPKTGEIHVPKITLLQVEANGKTFFIRAAETTHDAQMLFRTKEPVEDQLRFDREPPSD